jgi:hypothetical protein
VSGGTSLVHLANLVQLASLPLDRQDVQNVLEPEQNQGQLGQRIVLHLEREIVQLSAMRLLKAQKFLSLQEEVQEQWDTRGQHSHNLKQNYKVESTLQELQK